MAEATDAKLAPVRSKRKWPRPLGLVDLWNQPIKTTKVKHTCIFDKMPARKNADGNPMLDQDGRIQMMTCAYRHNGLRKPGCRRRRSNRITLNAKGDCPLRKPVYVALKPVKEDGE